MHVWHLLKNCVYFYLSIFISNPVSVLYWALVDNLSRFVPLHRHNDWNICSVGFWKLRMCRICTNNITWTFVWYVSGHIQITCIWVHYVFQHLRAINFWIFLTRRQESFQQCYWEQNRPLLTKWRDNTQPCWKKQNMILSYYCRIRYHHVGVAPSPS